MTPRDQVIHEIERLRRLAAAVHVAVKPAEATQEEVERFAAEAGVPVGDDLLAFWLAGESFVLMPRPYRRFDSTPFRYARRDWLGYEQEVRMYFGPQAGQVVHVRVPGTKVRGLVSIGSDGCGDDLYFVLRGGPRWVPGQVLHWDHETDEYGVVAEGLPAFLRASNDLVERDENRAFFSGDAVSRIFHFPGLDELRRQLDAGLSPDHAWRGGHENLLGTAVAKGRDDVFQELLERGADPDVALVEAALRMRFELAEVALRRGADPAARVSDGTTLLATAALAGRPRTVALLVRHGVRGRVGEEAYARLVAEVTASARLAERKKRQVLDALGAQ